MSYCHDDSKTENHLTVWGKILQTILQKWAIYILNFISRVLIAALATSFAFLQYLSFANYETKYDNNFGVKKNPVEFERIIFIYISFEQ